MRTHDLVETGDFFMAYPHGNIQQNMTDNQAVLNAVVANTEMGKNTMDQLIELTQDRNLRASFLNQQKEYRRLNQAAHTAIEACGGRSEGQTPFAKLSTKVGIWSQTIADKSNRNLADMVIQGATQGIMDCEKTRKDYPGASSGAKKLLDELQQFEERTAQDMRRFL